LRPARYLRSTPLFLLAFLAHRVLARASAGHLFARTVHPLAPLGLARPRSHVRKVRLRLGLVAGQLVSAFEDELMTVYPQMGVV
jgi:hypothetical protein